MQFLFVPVLAAILIALLRGGHVKNFARLHLRHPWLPPAMFFLQATIVLFPHGRSEFFLELRPWINLTTYAMLIAFLVVNRSLPGMRFILIGAALNLAVIVANGGYMPVTSEALSQSGHLDMVYMHDDRAFVLGSKDIVLPQDQTRLLMLSDVVKMPDWMYVPATFSIGDIFIMIGAAWLPYRTIRGIPAEKDSLFLSSSPEETR